MRRVFRACVLRVKKRVRRRNDRAGERKFSDVRANGGRSSCNEIQPHWIHGAASGVERPSLLTFLVQILKTVLASAIFVTISSATQTAVDFFFPNCEKRRFRWFARVTNLKVVRAPDEFWQVLFKIWYCGSR